jgi:hypothetical protein
MRLNKDVKLTPLADAGVTESIVRDFWNKQPFDLGLPKISGASNCDLCFLKGAGIIMGLIAQKPERAVWWAAMEVKDWRQISVSDRPSYVQMMKFSKDQQPLFPDETIPCYCGD